MNVTRQNPATESLGARVVSTGFLSLGASVPQGLATPSTSFGSAMELALQTAGSTLGDGTATAAASAGDLGAASVPTADADAVPVADLSSALAPVPDVGAVPVADLVAVPADGSHSGASSTGADPSVAIHPFPAEANAGGTGDSATAHVQSGANEADVPVPSPPTDARPALVPPTSPAPIVVPVPPTPATANRIDAANPIDAANADTTPADSAASATDDSATPVPAASSSRSSDARTAGTGAPPVPAAGRPDAEQPASSARADAGDPRRTAGSPVSPTAPAASEPAASHVRAADPATPPSGSTAIAPPTTPAAVAPPVVTSVTAPAPQAPAPQAPAPQAPAPQAPAPPLTAQLAGPVFSLASAGTGDHVMTVTVAPDDLGPVTVRAQVSADGIRVELFAPTDAGREALRGIMNDLRRDLGASGSGASLDLSPHDEPAGDGARAGDPESRAERMRAPTSPSEETIPAPRSSLSATSTTIDVLV